MLVILLTCVFLWRGVQSALVIDNSLTVWFLEDDPALVAYQHFGERFGNDEVVILMVKDEQTLLSPRYFSIFLQMTQALQAIPEVESVIGPGNTTIPTREALGVFAKPLFLHDTDGAEVRKMLEDVPILREQLFAADFKTARFLVMLKKLPDFDKRRGDILDRVQSTVHRYVPSNQAFFGGVGIIYAGLNALSQQDFGFFLGVGYLIMFILFLVIYRKMTLLIYMMGIVALSTYVTLGIYGSLGFRLNLMTVLLPVIIVLLGIMDAIHVINERNQLREEGLSIKEGALQALQKVFYPCLFTTLTTAAGFLALQTSPMAILKNFGLFAALGIFLCLFFTYLLGVLLLTATQPAKQTTTSAGKQLAQFLTFVLNRKRLFTGVSLALMLFFVLGLTRLKSDTYTLGYFPNEHVVVRDHQAMEEAWGPYMPLELLVEPQPGHSLYSVEVVRAALAFADSARNISGIGQVFGYYSLYQSGLQAQYKEKSQRMLGSKSALLMAYKTLKRDYPELFIKFVHEPSQTGRITISGAMVSANDLRAKMDTLMRMADATLGKVANVRPAGYQPMYAGIVNYVTSSQINSLLMSFGVVFGLVWLFIRHLKLAALTVIPNLFPVLVMLGVMGWCGINLDTATASIAAIVLSFCVDDSIHFIYTYHQNRKAGHTPTQARVATITHVGPAIVLTAIILFLGYLFMVFASLKTVQLWGILTAISIVGALYGEMILFPLVLERFDKETGETR